MGVSPPQVSGRVSSAMAEPVDKALLGFLTGLARRQYCGEEQFTDQILREEVLGGMTEEGMILTAKRLQQLMILSLQLFCVEYGPFLRRYQAILSNMVSGDMDYTQLDAFLTSQMKKRQVSYSNRY